MAQGALKKSKAPTSGKGLKKAASVKRAVETAKKTRKGAMQKNPKRAQLKEAHKESLELTKAINADNEEHFTAQAAAQPGGKLSVLKAPVAATADQKQRAKKSLKPGNVHGFARQ